MSSITKRLVYHFYAGRGCLDNVANICHFRCLKYYSEVFDEAIIVIVCDDNLVEDANEIKKKFIDILNTPNITFKIRQNNPYYEAGTFYDEIVDNPTPYGGLTFFGHNKGVSNVFDEDKSKTAILSWICALYYYGLNFTDEVEKELCSKPSSIFYGPYLMQDSYIANKYHLWYAGTFYWVNSERLKRNRTIPVMCDREYAEWLPGEIGGIGTATSHGLIYLPDSDLYRNWKYYARNCADSEKEYEDYLWFKDRCTEGLVDEKRYTVLTYNFGGYEIMRELGAKLPDVEYIYVTDDPTLTSETWEVVYDESLDGLDVFEKVMRVRENPFKYCSTSLCIRIDASIEVLGSLDKLVDDFYMANKDIGVMVHPERDNAFDEYDKWISFRGCDPSEKEEVIESLKENGCDLSVKGLYETGFMIYMKSPYVKRFLGKYSKLIRNVVDNCGKIRVDQVVFSAALNTYRGVYVWPMSHDCIQSQYLQSMEHNSCFTCVVTNIPETGYLMGEEKKLYNLNA